MWEIPNRFKDKYFYPEDGQVQWEAAWRELKSPSLERLSSHLEMALNSLAQLDLL